jgi:hypothetical protein
MPQAPAPRVRGPRLPTVAHTKHPGLQAAVDRAVRAEVASVGIRRFKPYMVLPYFHEWGIPESTLYKVIATARRCVEAEWDGLPVLTEPKPAASWMERLACALASLKAFARSPIWRPR